MSFSQGAVLVFVVIVSLVVCASLRYVRYPLRAALSSASCGIAVFGAVNLLAIYTGISIALNYATAFVAVVLGAPGVIGLLFLRILFLQ